MMRLLLAVLAATILFSAHAEARSYRHHHDRYSYSVTKKRHYTSRHYAYRIKHRYARQYAYHHPRYRRSYASSYKRRIYAKAYTHRRSYASRGRAVYHGGMGSIAGLGPRPRAWCGYWLRSQFGGGPEYNLAANWRFRGRATSPQVGAVVVFPHHVGVIVGPCSGGRCLVKSGNYNNRVATANMSIRGAIAFRQL